MRTNAMFESILENTPPPDTPALRGVIPNVSPVNMTEGQRKQLKNDAVGRCMMLWQLLTDTSGRSGMMFGEAPGKGVDVGDEVRRKAEEVKSVIFQ